LKVEPDASEAGALSVTEKFAPATTVVVFDTVLSAAFAST